MTVFELHLAIDQKLQEQGSYLHDRIFPEAKDIALNQAQEQILEQIIDDKISQTKVRFNHILPLLEKNKTLPLIANFPDLETRGAVARLNPTIYTVLNARAKVVTNIKCQSIPHHTQGKPFYYASFSFPESASLTGPYYNGFSITNNAAETIYSLPTALSGRFSSKDQKYEIIQDILDTVNTPDGSRFIRYDDGVFTIWSTLADVSYTLSYDHPAGGVDQTVTQPAINGNELTFHQAPYDANTDLTSAYYPLRWIEPDHGLYQKIMLNKFTRPKPSEPFFTISKLFLWIYYAKDSIVTNVQVDYIRKPKKISLILNRTSELDPSVHEQIVDRAVEILKKNIQDQTLPGDVQYNQITTRK